MADTKTVNDPQVRLTWEQQEGRTFPLGATHIAENNSINFAIYSKHATQVRLLLFSEDDFDCPQLAFDFDYLKNKSGAVWHCRISHDQIGNSVFYAYQVSGLPPDETYSHHCFDNEKLLLDPYAKVVFFPPEFERKAAIEPGSNIGKAPLAVLPRPDFEFDWGSTTRPQHDHDLVIYELHVKGFTANANSQVSNERRGTFAGVIEKIPYLKDLGITAVELMPVFQFDPQEENYWGYMPLNFFAPHGQYSTAAKRGIQKNGCCEVVCEPCDEFRKMVRALHDAGIEVILDVVYNHTCEQGNDGPTYSFKGIDTSTYYMLEPGAADPFVNFSGTGNTMHTVNAATRQLIIDSLRYWVQQMHVDGFRFDLASIFTRYPDGQINTEDPPIFSQIAAENDLAGIKLIAEPWDAVGTTQLGKRFPGHLWLQWNADYRDTIQRFVRGDPGMVPSFMTRVYGSADLFPDDRFHAFRPCQSVNYFSSHDGMTLYDLVSYNSKNNWSNGQGNRDGANEFRWNCGWEGDDNVPRRVTKLRLQQSKNYFTILMLSNGTPMIRMGDEFLNTQFGNNNPYKIDNETTWVDWSRHDANVDFYRFVKMLIAFRKSHPSISRSRFWRNDINWYGTTHDPDLSDDSKVIAWCLHGAALNDDDLYVMVNASDYDQQFGIHEGTASQWRKVIDTAASDKTDIVEFDNAPPMTQSLVVVSARSLVVLVRPHNS